MIRRIAITGPESTGKSQLSEELAAYFQTIWVPEYAREYIAKLDRPYNDVDILHIAQGQIAAEENLLFKANKLLFCDTELIVTKIWCEHKYGFCHDWILNMLEKPRYDFYLLCNIDLPWEYDVQREHPELRKYFFDLYFNELTKRNYPFAVINDAGKIRLNNAVEFVNKLLQKPSP